jgi:hypothetical protein
MLLQRSLQRIVGFAQRQTPDFRLVVWRRALHGVASGLSTQYNSIYATLRGANAVQLGSLESVGNAIGALAAVPAGWFISISMALASSMTAEIIPKEQMGRWIGIVSLFRGLPGIPAPLLGGLLWSLRFITFSEVPVAQRQG